MRNGPATITHTHTSSTQTPPIHFQTHSAPAPPQVSHVHGFVVLGYQSALIAVVFTQSDVVRGAAIALTPTPQKLGDGVLFMVSDLVLLLLLVGITDKYPVASTVVDSNIHTATHGQVG